jgi:hypothetical protein
VKKDLKVKKMQLSRETLNNLDSTDLQVAVGGATAPCTNFCTKLSCGRLTCLC